ncbi:hypothetical protein RND81_03G066100 [Saponaria officinalis]|uniref:BZIP domain-containing protein n=1 Tax=Saponaria officinalis TaxID=3572 RepID=A0AAW1M666_SAPOF
MNTTPPPPRTAPGHRRAHSDTSFMFSSSSDMEDDDFLFDIDNFNLSSLDLISPSPPPPATKSGESPEISAVPPQHLRSASVDANFFDGLSFGAGGGGGGGGGGERKVHRRTNSMDGGSCSSSMDDGDGYVMVDGVKKAMPPEKLAELALIDPKRAKRILANRQSAARSKERKTRYTHELERKVQTLQTEATTLSAQVTLLQRDTSGLSAENKELKLRLQAWEQQAQLRDALNEALTHEVQRLRMATGEMPTSGNNNSSGRGHFPQFPPQLQNLPHFSSQQNHQQQQQQQQQQQFQMQNQNQNQTSANQKQLKPSFLDFNRRD